MFLRFAIKSLLNRKGSVALTLLAMTVSVFVLFAVEHIRHQSKQSFANTVSGVDLIVGARTSRLNLLLYSVFRIGAPTNNVSFKAFETLSAHPQISWAIPISLGDSHKGYRVVGTTEDYFKHFSYGQKHQLQFQEGQAFENVFDLVLGATVAKQLNYELGHELVLSHGLVDTAFSRHDKFLFKVVGILEPTGTPVDQTLHVSLAGIEAIHIKSPRSTLASDEQLKQLKPKSITAVMLGLKSRIATFTVQRGINTNSQEPLLAILPGVALSELWQMMSFLEGTLQLVSLLVFIAALLGLSAMLLSSIRSRTHEIYLLRAIGARPRFLFMLIQVEALLITTASIFLGALLLTVCLFLGKDAFVAHFGMHINYHFINQQSFIISGSIVLASIVISSIPSFQAYSQAKQA